MSPEIEALITLFEGVVSLFVKNKVSSAQLARVVTSVNTGLASYNTEAAPPVVPPTN